MRNLNRRDALRLERAKKKYADILKKLSPYLTERVYTKHTKYSEWDAITNPILKTQLDEQRKETVEK